MHALTVFALFCTLEIAQASGVRDNTRLVRPGGTAVTQTQANELTLTLTDAAMRPIQTWIRTAGTLHNTGKILAAVLHSPEAQWVQVGQRVRSFPVSSRTQMHQGKVTRVTKQPDGVLMEATLADYGGNDDSRYLMEIVVDRGRFLSVPNVSIIEEGDRHVVYLQEGVDHYMPRAIEIGLQGELYTQVVDGLKEGDQVVSIGSFFVNAEYKLKYAGAD